MHVDEFHTFSKILMTQVQTPMQDKLLASYQQSSDNMLNSKAKVIRPYIFTTIEDIQSNKQISASQQNILKDIQSRCRKYTGQNSKKGRKTKKSTSQIVDVTEVDNIMARHQEVLSSIKSRIERDIEVAIKQINLSEVLTNPTSKPNPNAVHFKSAQDVESDDDEFFVEEAPQAAIIRH